MDQELADELARTGTFAGIEPAGARVEYVGAGFLRVSNGLIEEAWIVGDTQVFWTALGRPEGRHQGRDSPPAEHDS